MNCDSPTHHGDSPTHHGNSPTRRVGELTTLRITESGNWRLSDSPSRGVSDSPSFLLNFQKPTLRLAESGSCWLSDWWQNLPPVSLIPVANCHRCCWHRQQICRRYHWHRWQICHCCQQHYQNWWQNLLQVSLIPVANLPLVSLKLVVHLDSRRILRSSRALEIFLPPQQGFFSVHASCSFLDIFFSYSHLTAPHLNPPHTL